MNDRPFSVTIIGCLYVVVGAVAVAYHLTDFKPQHPFQYDIVWAILVNLIAIVSGVYILRGSDWARWLALAWIGFHVILSAFHTPSELAIHSLFCAILAYFFFRPAASRYFRAART